jgi:hypothetical protein
LFSICEDSLGIKLTKNLTTNLTANLTTNLTANLTTDRGSWCQPQCRPNWYLKWHPASGGELQAVCWVALGGGGGCRRKGQTGGCAAEKGDGLQEESTYELLWAFSGSRGLSLFK